MWLLLESTLPPSVLRRKGAGIEGVCSVGIFCSIGTSKTNSNGSGRGLFYMFFFCAVRRGSVSTTGIFKGDERSIDRVDCRFWGDKGGSGSGVRLFSSRVLILDIRRR